jgi:hypothetical protein
MACSRALLDGQPMAAIPTIQLIDIQFFALFRPSLTTGTTGRVYDIRVVNGRLFFFGALF